MRHPRLTLQRLTVPAVLLLALCLASCGVPGVVKSGSTLPSAKPTPTTAPLPPLRLPQDEAPHTDLTEWWYYTGHLHGADPNGGNHDYGFELTFFQISRGSLPPLYVGHYAVTDITRGQFHFDQRLLSEPNAVLPNGTTTTGFKLAIGSWRMDGVNGVDHLAADTANYATNFTLQGQKPAALHNGNGLISYGVTGFSYYYSRTHMALTGSIVDHGVTIPVTGLAWMDHQWGDFIPTAGGGWDWYSIQLANNVEYMLYIIRSADGKTLSTVGTRIAADGAVTEVDPAQIHSQALGTWTSPATKVVYPSGWLVSLPEGTLTVTPAVKDQELITTNSTGNTYWEGAGTVTGTLGGQAVTGQAYTELTGYLPAK